MAKYPKTLGRIEAVWNKLGGEEGVDRFLAGELEVKEIQPPPLLIPRGTVKVGPLQKPFDPEAFFQTRTGLYVWPEFVERILSQVESVAAAPETELAYADLSRVANGSEIKLAVSPEKLITQLWFIADLIAKQERGQIGPLLTNGHANLFYLGGFVVRVHWYAGLGRWFVSAWPLDGFQWSAGCRVFSCN